jgi:hypothetical protein
MGFQVALVLAFLYATYRADFWLGAGIVVLECLIVTYITITNWRFR